jgi:hypothetical protein
MLLTTRFFEPTISSAKRNSQNQFNTPKFFRYRKMRRWSSSYLYQT